MSGRPGRFCPTRRVMTEPTTHEALAKILARVLPPSEASDPSKARDLCSRGSCTREASWMLRMRPPNEREFEPNHPSRG